MLINEQVIINKEGLTPNNPNEKVAFSFFDTFLGTALSKRGTLRNKYSLGKQFTELDLENAEFAGEDLEWSNFEKSNLHGASFSRANLQRANFENANLSDADLDEANLERAILRNCDLHGSDLTGAILNYANLDGAKLNGADLTGTDMKYIRYRNTSFCGSIFDDNTFLPFSYDEAIAKGMQYI